MPTFTSTYYKVYPLDEKFKTPGDAAKAAFMYWRGAVPNVLNIRKHTDIDEDVYFDFASGEER